MAYPSLQQSTPINLKTSSFFNVGFTRRSREAIHSHTRLPSSDGWRLLGDGVARWLSCDCHDNQRSWTRPCKSWIESWNANIAGMSTVPCPLQEFDDDLRFRGRVRGTYCMDIDQIRRDVYFLVANLSQVFVLPASVASVRHFVVNHVDNATSGRP